LSLFAIMALCLAMSGVYGVMAYAAAQRSKEIGVRMALGATRGRILRLVVGRSVRLTAIGLAVGVCGALAATRLFGGMLFEVPAYDLATYAGVLTGLGLLAVLAAFVPALRATRIEPVRVLRQE
jgi:putative ABC transport system permease protein